MAFETDITQHVIQFGAIAAAFTAVAVMYGWLWPKLKRFYVKVQWIMSDESDHKVIIQMIADVAEKLEPNGGTSIVDSLARIEHSVIFQGARQRATAHMNKKPVFETDSAGHVVFVNSSYKKAFGITEPEDMGWVNIIPHDKRQGLVEKWFNAVRDKRAFNEFSELINAEGVPVKVHVFAETMRSEDNEIFLGHHGEVTFL